MTKIFQKLLLSALPLVVVGISKTSFAAEGLTAGAHVGAVGTSGGSAIGYGFNITANPYGYAAFRVDATFADFGQNDGTGNPHGRYFSTSPAIVFYPVALEEMQIGILGGAGFYVPPRYTGVSETKFGVNVGLVGDFNLSNRISVGMEMRYHGIIDAKSLYTVYLTAGYRFDMGDEW